MEKNQKKKCFVIMPISDQDGYEKGHFTRVYNHIIKPACIKAGFEPIRADDESKTNYIILDILRKIIDAEIVLCDLSSKNANVLYELGIRQAFNKKAILIKDNKTGRIFDIQGLRTIEYDENLRIDEVEKSINQISKTLSETENSSDDDINSLIQMLSIQPASLPGKIEISQESSLIIEMLGNISKRITTLEENTPKKIKFSDTGFKPLKSGKTYINKIPFDFGDEVRTENEMLGILIDEDNEFFYFEKDTSIFRYKKTDSIFKKTLPF